jgi:hypothetical protein
MWKCVLKYDDDDDDDDDGDYRMSRFNCWHSCWVLGRSRVRFLAKRSAVMTEVLPHPSRSSRLSSHSMVYNLCCLERIVKQTKDSCDDKMHIGIHSCSARLNLMLLKTAYKSGH